MTRIFTDDGTAVPVTVLDVANNRVTQIKTPETDGYAAVQVTFGKRRASRVTKPHGRPPREGGRRSGRACCANFRSRPEQLAELKVGGVDRRRHVQGRRAGRRHRHDEGQGLLGRDQAPPLQLEPRVARQLALAQHARLDRHGAGPGPRVPGQAHGGPARQRDAHRRRRSKVVRVDAERGLLLVKGSVPGADGGHIVVRRAAKTPGEEGGLTWISS